MEIFVFFYKWSKRIIHFKYWCVFFPAEYFLEDSDLDGLSDITVSSVHTSDLSSFEEESEDEEQPSDSSEEGELPPDGLNFSTHFEQFTVLNLKITFTTDV